MVIANQLIADLQSKGCHINHKRVAVVQCLCKQQNPITAEALWLQIRTDKRISIAAVYNNLNLLEKEGFVTQYRGPDDSKKKYILKIVYRLPA